MTGARAVIGVAAALWLAAVGRDGFDDWVAATVLPPLVPETSVLVEDRDGRLLRAYTVADGRWRLALAPDAVDPQFLRMLVAYEDGRDHAGGAAFGGERYRAAGRQDSAIARGAGAGAAAVEG